MNFISGFKFAFGIAFGLILGVVAAFTCIMAVYFIVRQYFF